MSEVTMYFFPFQASALLAYPHFFVFHKACEAVIFPSRFEDF